MKFYHLVTGLLRVNTFFIVNELNEAVVIDCGENYQRVKETEKNCGFKIKAVLLTHAHFDHAGCAKKLQDDGAKIYISKNDADKLHNELNLGKRFGRNFEDLTADFTFGDGEEITVCSITFKVCKRNLHFFFHWE